MADDPDPPRKFFQLKPKEFERLNEAPREPGSEPSADATSPSAANTNPAAGRIDVRDLARQAAAGAPLLGVNAPVNRPNEVHAMLQENLRHANAAGLNDVPLKPKRRSRRLRDYWLVMIPVNGFFAWWALGPFSNPITMIYAFSGIILFSCSFTWVMFWIVEDY